MLDNSEQEVKSGPNPSTGPSDDSPNSEPLSTATPGSAAISCDETKDLVRSTGAPILVVDDSTKHVRITRGARICGTTDQDLIRTFLEQICDVTLKNGKNSLQNLRSSVAIQDSAPRNPLEGMLEVQTVAVHTLAMEFLERASRGDQTIAGIDANVHRGVRLVRTVPL